MEVGDIVTWEIDNTTRTCEIFNIYNKEGEDYYDVVLSERNVLFESIYVPLNHKVISKGDTVIYKKNGNIYEAYVSKIDWSSNSAQIQIIMRGLYILK